MENDPIIKAIIKILIGKYRCHTVILYGSRARGLTTSTSDYDVVGIRKSGKKFRIAKKHRGFFWDVFIYPEKDLRKLGQNYFHWKGAQILYQKGKYGNALLKRLNKILKKPFKPWPQYEVDVTKVWAQKQLERCRVNDIQARFRHFEFLTALVEHYFYVRQKRYNGPKEGFAWIKQNDMKTFKLINRALEYPNNLTYLKAAAMKVYRVSLN